MGNISGTEFVRNDKIEGQGKQTLLDAKRIHLRKKELDRIFLEYSKYEDKVAHTIDIKNIMLCNKLSISLFGEVYFQLFDLQKTGVLNFQQYMITMWSFLTTTEDEMARLCWGMFEIDNRNTLDLDEVKYLINFIWSFKPSKRCLKALRKLELNKDGIITRNEFILLNQHHRELLLPVRQMKVQLQRRTVYKRFWRELTVTRVENFAEQSLFEVWEAPARVLVQSSMEYLNLQVQSGRVPSQYVEQWRTTQRRKAQRGAVHSALPYEIREKIEPPLPTIKPKMKKTKSSRSNGSSSNGRKKSFKYGSVADDPLFQDDLPDSAVD